VAGSESFDVVIIGAGAAGCVVARRLAASDRSILLLEAGPDFRSMTPAAMRDGWTLPTVPDWGFESEPRAEGGTQKLRRGRLVGGTSWLTRFAVRGAAADFDAWAARGNPTWSFEDVLPIFRRIESDAEFGARPWHGDTGPLPITRYPELDVTEIHAAASRAMESIGFATVDDHNAPDALGVGRMPMNAVGGRRVTAADAFLVADVDVAGLSIRADTPVASVVIQDERASGIRLVDGDEIHAGHVVLAAGTYGSPALLLRSGIGPAQHLRELGIPRVVDLPGVGANLADHPGVDVDSGWRGAGVQGPVLHSIGSFRSTLSGPNDPPDLMIWVADPVGEEASFEFEVMLMKAHSRGSVRLRSTDPTATPRITLPGVRDERDIERLVEGRRLLVELATMPEFRQVACGESPTLPSSAAEVRRGVVEDSYSVPHVVGTCRMGPSGDDGDVVDEFGRVHGVRSLSVIDASIIPEPTAGFPHLVTIMLADRLGESLAGRG
jgi:choline dehydrogenase